MENLTKEEVVKRHREMWNWIADETEKQNRVVIEEEAFAHFGWPLNATYKCWCCSYSLQKINKNYIGAFPDLLGSRCVYCPIGWPSGRCMNEDSPYCKWSDFAEKAYENGNNLDENLIKQVAKLAREIADLPIKED